MQQSIDNSETDYIDSAKTKFLPGLPISNKLPVNTQPKLITSLEYLHIQKIGPRMDFSLSRLDSIRLTQELDFSDSSSNEKESEKQIRRMMSFKSHANKKEKYDSKCYSNRGILKKSKLNRSDSIEKGDSSRSNSNKRSVRFHQRVKLYKYKVFNKDK